MEAASPGKLGKLGKHGEPGPAGKLASSSCDPGKLAASSCDPGKLPSSCDPGNESMTTTKTTKKRRESTHGDKKERDALGQACRRGQEKQYKKVSADRNTATDTQIPKWDQGGETRPKSYGKQTKTTKADRNSRRLHRPDWFMYQNPYRMAALGRPSMFYSPQTYFRTGNSASERSGVRPGVGIPRGRPPRNSREPTS